MARLRHGIGYVALLAVTLASAGCAVQIPADPLGTLERVQHGVLRVGVTEHAPWVEGMNAPDGDAAPSGTEPELITEFALGLDAEVVWTSGSEAVLADALDRGELDVIIGGFLAETPWAEQGAVTRPYATTETPHGEQQHVMITRMGENRFLVALETFLLEQAES